MLQPFEAEYFDCSANPDLYRGSPESGALPVQTRQTQSNSETIRKIPNFKSQLPLENCQLTKNSVSVFRKYGFAMKSIKRPLEGE
jgi:hypothetical protein